MNILKGDQSNTSVKTAAFAFPSILTLGLFKILQIIGAGLSIANIFLTFWLLMCISGCGLSFRAYVKERDEHKKAINASIGIGWITAAVVAYFYGGTFIIRTPFR